MFNVQNDSGTVDGANSYISVEYFLEYHEARGNDVSGFQESEIQIANVRATDFLDIKFSFIGKELNEYQDTSWPRDSRDGIPKAVKEATAEYSFRALNSVLAPDPDFDTAGKVKSIVDKTGPLEDRIEYFEHADYVLPEYPMADKKIIKAGLVIGGSIGFLTR